MAVGGTLTVPLSSAASTADGTWYAVHGLARIQMIAVRHSVIDFMLFFLFFVKFFRFRHDVTVHTYHL